MAVLLLNACDNDADSSSDLDVTFEGELDAIIQLCNDLSVFFQIRDDFINIFSVRFAEQKGFAEDMTEGKFSFLVVHAIDTLKRAKDTAAAEELVKILGMHSDEASVKQRGVDLLVQGGCLQYTKKYLNDLRDRILAQVEKMGGNPRVVKIMEALQKDLADIRD